MTLDRAAVAYCLEGSDLTSSTAFRNDYRDYTARYGPFARFLDVPTIDYALDVLTFRPRLGRQDQITLFIKEYEKFERQQLLSREVKRPQQDSTIMERAAEKQDSKIDEWKAAIETVNEIQEEFGSNYRFELQTDGSSYRVIQVSIDEWRTIA